MHISTFSGLLVRLLVARPVLPTEAHLSGFIQIKVGLGLCDREYLVGMLFESLPELLMGPLRDVPPVLISIAMSMAYVLSVTMCTLTVALSATSTMARTSPLLAVWYPPYKGAAAVRAGHFSQ